MPNQLVINNVNPTNNLNRPVSNMSNIIGILTASAFSLGMINTPITSPTIEIVNLPINIESNIAYNQQNNKRSGLRYRQRKFNSNVDNTNDNQISNPTSASDHMKFLIERVDSFSNLKDDWDGYGGSAPVLNAMSNTLDFLHNVPSFYINNLLEGNILPSSYGTITCEWNKPNGDFLSVEIGSKEIAYFYEINDKEGETSENIKITSNDSYKEVILMLKTLYSHQSY